MNEQNAAGQDKANVGDGNDASSQAECNPAPAAPTTQNCMDIKCAEMQKCLHPDNCQSAAPTTPRTDAFGKREDARWPDPIGEWVGFARQLAAAEAELAEWKQGHANLQEAFEAAAKTALKHKAELTELKRLSYLILDELHNPTDAKKPSAPIWKGESDEQEV